MAISKCIADFAVFVTVAIYLGIVQNNPADKVPVAFQVYDIDPFHDLTDVTKFWETKYITKTFCTDVNTPAGCDAGTLELDFLIDLRETMSCNDTSVARPPFCHLCIDEWAPRLHAYAVGTGILGTKLAITKDTKRLRDELEGCIGREATPRTITHKLITNPWIYLYLWCGLAWVASFSSCFKSTAIEEGAPNRQLFKVHSMDNGVINPIVTAVLVVAVLFFALFPLYWLDGVLSTTYDLYPVIFISIFVIAFYAVLFYSRYVNSEAYSNMLFGGFLISAAPCMAMIVNTFHAWLDHDMLVSSVALLSVLMGLCLMDDLMNIVWSKQSSLRDAKHIHIHSTLLLVTFFTIFLFSTLNYPNAPVNDKFGGTMLNYLLQIFLVSMVAGSLVLQEVAQKETGDIFIFKQALEFFFRFSVFIVMSYVIGKSTTTV